MTEPESADGLAERGFTEAGQAITTALEAVNRLRDLADGGGVQAGGYLAYAAGRLGEALHGLALARKCDAVAKEKCQAELFKFRSCDAA